MKSFKAHIFFLFVTVAGIVALIPVKTASAGTAGISLSDASATMTQTSDTAWTLAKDGAVDAAHSTVTWTITATEAATIAGQLVLNGTFTVTNTGTGDATIGNIVVNLQTKSGAQWVTRSSDIANATDGDAATTANIFQQASSENKSTFTENAASGELEFMDASTNTLFSLVPQVTIPAGDTVTLLFSAAYDNTVLNLATGTPVRAEIIVSFGNATTNGASAPNIDINGNGMIDSDEARVRSVPSRLTLAVPAQTNGSGAVTLSDTLADIATNGTVTFSNAMFNLGATTGTVSVNYNAGTSGGTITNCAHLTSAGSTVSIGGFNFPTSGLDLLACDTQTIDSPTCTPGTVGCGWKTGDLVSFDQGEWGAATSSPAPTILSNNYFGVYPFGVVEVGIPGTAGFSMSFTSGGDIIAYLPGVGTPAALTADLLNPLTTASGSFGAEVLALTLNVDFTEAGLTGGTSGIGLGDLTLCGFTTLPALNGRTVSDLLTDLNTLLGGGSATYGISQLAPVVESINTSFLLGAPSTFAQQQLFNAPCQ